MDVDYFVGLNDGNSDVSLVILMDGTPYCKLHGAMNKVSREGIWRCIRTEAGFSYGHLSSQERQELKKGKDCRAGCKEIIKR